MRNKRGPIKGEKTNGQTRQVDDTYSPSGAGSATAGVPGGSNTYRRGQGTNQFTVQWTTDNTDRDGAEEGPPLKISEPNRAPGGGRNPSMQPHAPWNAVQDFGGRVNMAGPILGANQRPIGDDTTAYPGYEYTGETPGAWDAPNNARSDVKRDLEAKALNASRVRQRPGQN